ncbi:MAG: hypothetical protein K2M06_04725 [Muribaculaceae bacterium]|nr:hypothetical protein [Muribaculaceae bacterium]
MKQFYHRTESLALVIAVGALSLTSCIDDNYDLSDIDTTTEVKVNDLTIPINFKEIYLDKIIDLDTSNPDAVIKIETIDGKKYYCFSKGGSFDANPKSIDKVHAPAPDHIESSTIHISTNASLPAGKGMRKAQGAETDEYLEYEITPYSTEFTYKVGEGNNPKVDGAIQSIADVRFDETAPMVMTMKFHSDLIAEKASHVELYDVVINVPAGAIANFGDIEAKDGKITIPHLSSTTGEIELKIDLTGLNFVTAENPEGKKVVDGKFDFQEEVGVESGRFLVYPDDGFTLADLPGEIDFTTVYDMSAFTVSMFSGVFDYAIDFDEVDAFNLTDIPQFLRGGETNVILADPRLTLEVNSPVAEYGLECVAGLTLTAERSNGSSHSEILEKFLLGNESVMQFHLLAPKESYDGLPVGTKIYYTPFPGLSTILSGDGLPDKVRVDFKSPMEPKPRVMGMAKNFPLGKSLEQVHGDYKFSAPLALANGSVICYTTTVDGWNDEDVDAIAISNVKVTARATSTIPAGAKVFVRPIDVNGEIIPLSNAATAYATLNPLAQDQEISIELTGDIRHLDGIYVEAIVDQFDGETLSPDFTIKVSDLRASVTGSYTKKL